MKKMSKFIPPMAGQSSKLARGFTLIELIVAIGVLSILFIAAFTVLNPITQFQKANDARRKSDLAQIQKSLEVYYQDNGRYPDNSTTLDACGSISSCLYRIKTLDINNPVKNWGQSWQPYLNVLPKDPNPSKQYVYVSVNGQAYYLYASLDRGGSDPQACNVQGNDCSNVPAPKLCGNNNDYFCSYGVSSPNVTP